MPGSKGKHHSAKWHRCWESVQKRGYDSSSAAAICTWSIGKEGSYSASARRSLALHAAAAAIRTAQFDGREHIVVPVVALIEGVIHPINSPVPEFAPAESFTLAPQSWNGRPVIVRHPVDGKGEQVSANAPAILETAVGIVFNARADGKRLLMEAWLDKAKMEAGGKATLAILQRIQAADPADIVEISVGSFVLSDDVPGVFGGKRYADSWLQVYPDHLALLPAGDSGACDAAMGCGIRAAGEGGTMAAKANSSMLQRFLGSVIRALHGDLGMSDNDKRKKIEDALRATEGAGSNAYVEQVYEDDGAIVYSVSEVSGPTKYYRRDFSIGDDGAVSFGSEKEEVEPVMSYEPLAGVPCPEAEPQSVHDRSVELGAKCATAALGASACGCKETRMKREELIAALRAKMTAEQITQFTAAVKAKGSGDMLTAIIDKIVSHAPYVEEDRAWLEGIDESVLVRLAGIGEAPKKDSEPATPSGTPAAPAAPSYTGAAAAKTREEILAELPEDMRATLKHAEDAETARKTELIKALSAAQKEYTECQLKAMSVTDLERVGRLLKIATPAAVDFSGRALARDGDEPKGAPAPPDMGAMIRAAHAVK